MGSLRILHVHDASRQNPYLNAQAANVRWLLPALRRLGHEVEEVPLERLAAVREAGPFDIVHLHGAAGGIRPATRAVLTTRYGSETPQPPFVALTYRQLRADGTRAIAVIPPALDMANIPPERDAGDHLAMSFDGRDEYALGAAIAVATRQERPLVVVLDETAELSESCAAALRIGEQGGWLRVERLGRFDFPTAIWSAAAYLSFGRRGFDMAALTAMASGTPVIVFEGTPVSELVLHGESGFVCPSAELANMALENLDLLSESLARSRARILFDADAAAFRYVQLYRQLARAQGEQPPRGEPRERRNPEHTRKDGGTAA